MRKHPGIYLAALLLCLLLQSCGNNQLLWLDRQGGTYYEVTEHKDGRFFVIDSFGLDLDVRQRGLHGMRLKFHVADASGNWLTELFSDSPPEGYQLELRMYDEDKMPIYPHRFLWDTLMADTSCFYNESCRYAPTKPIEVFIPYSKLSVGPGKHDIYLALQGVGDSTIGKRNRPVKPDLKLELRLHYQQPPVIQTQLTIQSFALNPDSVDVHSFDYHVFGKGYPDLYWDLYLGDEIIYTSDVVPNSTSYSQKAGSHSFYMTPEDSVRLEFCDFDNFSKHDFIERIIFSYNDFKTHKSMDTSFGKIKNLKAEFRQF